MRAYGYRAGILIFFLLAAILYCSSIPLHFDDHVLDTHLAPVPTAIVVAKPRNVGNEDGP